MTNQKQKILIVEDDRFLHDLSKKKFINEGYQVVSAFNGKEALERAQTELPTLIVLDILLPEIDGMDVLESLKKDPKTRNIPVIIVSNYSDRERIQQGLKLGATDYMIKAHFSPDDIVKKVKEIIQKL
ncbi:MAG: hypothetical protein A3F54_03780 [Candidatus Kerfeldbacteria bacterium RIFCSPHIGHO2_12_FULL_48_17]|uniref:Response regulatory domain-containing protein n=1 Tax=Candidatus Kerfeldbacteria bacterium RIFCSPHIGHO2_12_FULL_48_17 TaxID=1798542 RepID=A0A1G2B7F6_9BACT|nr:MAG: hypothetical protein A3F54_03780 [Candidatus Kerfeldbacteria bacterium RIFCSPHIGHO2_12_FULL_48_17]